MHCWKLITWNNQIRIVKQMRQCSLVSRSSRVFFHMLKRLRRNMSRITQRRQNRVQDFMSQAFVVDKRLTCT